MFGSIGIDYMVFSTNLHVFAWTKNPIRSSSMYGFQRYGKSKPDPLWQESKKHVRRLRSTSNGWGKQQIEKLYPKQIVYIIFYILFQIQKGCQIQGMVKSVENDGKKWCDNCGRNAFCQSKFISIGLIFLRKTYRGKLFQKNHWRKIYGRFGRLWKTCSVWVMFFWPSWDACFLYVPFIPWTSWKLGNMFCALRYSNVAIG